MTKYISLEHAIRNAVRDQQYKKVNEDFEFEMARNELRTAIDAAKRLMTHLDGDGELEAWVQSKITKGADYLDTVADYMDSRDTKKLKEETEEIMEALKTLQKIKDVDKPSKMGTAFDIATDFLPVASNVKSAASAVKNVKSGNYGAAAVDTALALPGVGNVAKAAGAVMKLYRGAKVNLKNINAPPDIQTQTPEPTPATDTQTQTQTQTQDLPLAIKPPKKPPEKEKDKKKPPKFGNYTPPPPRSEYHAVPVQTSVSQARAHRVFKEEKLAGVVKSVVKKKKEQKESGPNPLVDFEPKLNHKYDNET